MGSCACLKDGRDIIEHAQLHDCPEERFAARGLGDSVAWVFQQLGIHRVLRLYRDQTSWQHRNDDGASSNPSGCGCAQRRAALNNWVKYDRVSSKSAVAEKLSARNFAWDMVE
jgi:hypothetical protein